MNKSTILIFPLIVSLFLICHTIAVFGQTNAEDGKMTEPTMDYSQWAFDTSLTFSSGDFGTDTTTNTFYWPLTIARLFDKGDVAFTLPFIYQQTGPGIAALAGRPFQVRNNTAGSENDTGGVGDLLLKGRYLVFNETSQAFNLYTYAQIKFPTADDAKGLGTGEFDESLGLEANKPLNDLWTIYGDIGYTFIGDPPAVDLNNEFSYRVGVGYQVTKETQTTLSYQEKTALLDNHDNPRDIIVGLNHAMNQDITLYGDLGFGLSNGSPDISATLGTRYLF